MKTLQLISTVIFLTLTSASFANGDDDINKNSDNDNALTIVVINVEAPSCNGGSDGAIVVEAQGGQAPYSYNWNTFPAQYTAEATDLSSGMYFVEVTDANGDVFFRSVKVVDPTASVLNELDSETEGPIDITATVTGDNAPYNFSLNGAPANSENIHNLPVGIHKLIITDANECEMVQYIQVFELEGENLEGDSEKGFRINANKEYLKSRNETEVHTSVLTPTISVSKK